MEEPLDTHWLTHLYLSPPRPFFLLKSLYTLVLSSTRFIQPFPPHILHLLVLATHTTFRPLTGSSVHRTRTYARLCPISQLLPSLAHSVLYQGVDLE